MTETPVPPPTERSSSHITKGDGSGVASQRPGIQELSTQTGSEKPALTTRRVPRPVAAAIIGTALAASVAYPTLIHPRMEERALSSLSLDALVQQRDKRQDDPRYLYYLGRRLNDAELHREADPILRRAVGLDPDAPRLREEWTRALLGSGLVTAAFGQLKEYAAKHAELPDAHRLLGKFYLAQKALDKAAESFTRATTLNASDAESWRLLATCLEDRDAAIRAARRAVELRPQDAEAYLTLAPLLTKTGAVQEARTAYSKAVTLRPDSVPARREYAKFLLQSSSSSPAEIAAAVEEARRAVGLDTKDAASQLVLGQALLQTGRDAEAVEPLRQAAEQDKNAPAAALALRQVYARLGKQDEARVWQQAYLKRQTAKQQIDQTYDALRVNPNDSAAHRKLARLLARQGDVRGCIRQHAAALRAAQDAPPTLAAAANDLAAEGQALVALPLAERAVAVGQANPNSHEAMGNVLLALGRSREAAVSYSKAVSFQPERYDTLMGRLETYFAKRAAAATPAERAYRQAKRLRLSQIGPRAVTNEVLRLSRRAVELEPNNTEYLRFLLQNLVSRREDAETIQIGERLLALAPKDGVGNVLLAIVKANKATTPADWAAVEAHLDAAKDDPSMAASMHYGRGLVALARSQADIAITELEEAVRIDPSPDIYYYKLAAAYRMGRKLKEANRVVAIYGKRNAQKQEQQSALERVTLHPDRPELYEKAAQTFEKHGLPEQAAAIRSAARERFSGQRVPGVSKSPATQKGTEF